MTERTLHKSPSAGVLHHLTDYAAARREFNWREARRALVGGEDPRLNMAHEALERQIERGRADQVAVRFIDRDWNRLEMSYSELKSRAGRFANVLETLDAGRGSTVATLLGRVPELFTVGLGTLEAGRVFCSLFSAFGPEPLRTRLDLGHVRVLVTTEGLYRRKVAPIRKTLPELHHVLILRDSPGSDLPEDTTDFAELMSGASQQYATAPTQDTDIALLHFTSGTTGKPKGVTLNHAAVIAQHATSRLVLDLHPAEVFWCTADPGWVTGIAYGMLGPLTCGVTMVVDREEFDPRRWYRILEEERVNVWYTAPTAIRMLIKAGTALARERTFPHLRHLASVGEPLNAEAVLWGVEAFGMPFHDTWWQTETGAIMIANFAACDVLPGSMGRAVPGIEAQVARRTAGGGLEILDSAEQTGEIALKPGWPSMFSGYLEDPERYQSSFVDGWYLAGDLARRDAEGHFWFIGRADDVIKSSGHLISPFEVESTLMTHPAVAQVAVIGIPDPIAGQAVKAFIELKDGFAPSEALNRQIMGHARRLLGAVVAPREIAFKEALPRTRSGKLMRRLLRARELGLPEGDLSTLEGRE